MTDPFTTFAAVAGVAVLALQAIKSLHDDVQTIRDTSTTMKRLRQDLDAMANILQSLTTDTKGSLQHLNKDADAALAVALTNCKDACETFQAKLKKWMKHSAEHRLQWYDRIRVGILADKNVETLSKQLLQCKITVNTAIGTMILFASLQSHEATHEIRTSLVTREEALRQQIGIMDQEIAQLSVELASTRVSSQTGDNRQLADNKQPADNKELSDNKELGEHAAEEEEEEDLDAQRRSLQTTRDVFQALSTDINFQRTGQRIRDVEMTEKGRLLVGKFNISEHNGVIQQDISNVKVAKDGKGIVGIAQGLDINAFFA